MSTRIAATYVDGVFQARVAAKRYRGKLEGMEITVEPVISIEQFRGSIKIDPDIAAEIIDSADYRRS